MDGAYISEDFITKSIYNLLRILRTNGRTDSLQTKHDLFQEI